jgi:hypothetical protein
MADSVVRNATKDDIPIFDSSTDFGDQYMMENQNIDDMGPDEIIRMLEEDPYALDSLGQDTTTAPEEFAEPMDEIRRKFLEFGGSESEGGLADPSGILSTPQSDKVYMREGGLAMLGQIQAFNSGPLDSFRRYLTQTIDRQQVDPFIDEVTEMAQERFNLSDNFSGPTMNTFDRLTLRDPRGPFDFARPGFLRDIAPDTDRIARNIPDIPEGFRKPDLQQAQLFADGGGVSSLMKKTTVEMQEIPADRNMLVMNRIMKQGGVTQSRDPRLMSQLAQVLGRDG